MSTVLFTGCSHITQLHERLVVQGIGVDLVDGQYIAVSYTHLCVPTGTHCETYPGDFADTAPLLPAYNLSLIHISHGDFKPGTKFGEFPDSGQAFLSDLRQ